jgi:hypothetical protein
MGTFAYADTIIYNGGSPNQQNGNEATEWIQTENFTLAAAASLSKIEFWDIETSPGYAGTVTWWITGDNGGNPDFTNVIATNNQALTTHTLTANGCTVLGFFCEYDNTIAGLNVALSAGVEYHLALHNGPITDQTRSEFYWETTNSVASAPGLECDLTVFGTGCYQGNGSDYSSNGAEHAFILYSGGVATTPEPGTLMLMGSGLLAAVAGLRRRF